MRTYPLLVLFGIIFIACAPRSGPPTEVAPSPEATAPSAVHPDPGAKPEPASASRVTLEVLAGCTRMACPTETPCCNTCRFGGWQVVDSEENVLAKADNLPIPDVDGCGHGSFRLQAEGTVRDGVFEVTSWVQTPP